MTNKKTKRRRLKKRKTGWRIARGEKERRLPLKKERETWGVRGSRDSKLTKALRNTFRKKKRNRARRGVRQFDQRKDSYGTQRKSF